MARRAPTAMMTGIDPLCRSSAEPLRARAGDGLAAASLLAARELEDAWRGFIYATRGERLSFALNRAVTSGRRVGSRAPLRSCGWSRGRVFTPALGTRGAGWPTSSNWNGRPSRRQTTSMQFEAALCRAVLSGVSGGDFEGAVCRWRAGAAKGGLAASAVPEGSSLQPHRERLDFPPRALCGSDRAGLLVGGGSTPHVASAQRSDRKRNSATCTGVLLLSELGDVVEARGRDGAGACKKQQAVGNPPRSCVARWEISPKSTGCWGATNWPHAGVCRASARVRKQIGESMAWKRWPSSTCPSCVLNQGDAPGTPPATHSTALGRIQKMVRALGRGMRTS
jgi:hypothetical protein